MHAVIAIARVNTGRRWNGIVENEVKINKTPSVTDRTFAASSAKTDHASGPGLAPPTTPPWYETRKRTGKAAKNAMLVTRISTFQKNVNLPYREEESKRPVGA